MSIEAKIQASNRTKILKRLELDKALFHYFIIACSNETEATVQKYFAA